MLLIKKAKLINSFKHKPVQWSGELPLDLERNCLRESPRRLLEDPSGGILFLESRKDEHDRS
jgi:hypothetical protein